MNKTLEQTTIKTQIKTVLADTYTLLLKTQNYHWNVTGPNFYNYHLLFEAQYTELFAAVDELAERVRALGFRAPGSFAEFSQLSTIAEANNDINAKSMIEDLHQSNLQIIESLTQLRDIAAEENDAETQDIAIARIQVHQKAAWMLKSSI